MGIGVGIVLLVIGLILVTGAVNLPDQIAQNIATDTVGWICVLVGALSLVLAVVITRQRSRSTHVEERHYQP
jgi:hypothetical protein